MPIYTSKNKVAESITAESELVPQGIKIPKWVLYVVGMPFGLAAFAAMIVLYTRMLFAMLVLLGAAEAVAGFMTMIASVALVVAAVAVIVYRSTEDHWPWDAAN